MDTLTADTLTAQDTPAATDTLDANKALIRRFIDEIFLAGRLEAVDELVTDDFTGHAWGPGTPGPDGVRATMKRVAAGLSDARMTVEAMIAEGDLVAVRLTSSALQSGPFMGLQPSGRRYEIGEMHLFRVRDGRVAEHWHQGDFLGMLRQLGALPEPGAG